VLQKTPTRREENARATRGTLIATARELFAERGFADAGIEEIAARARVTTGALYHHFGSKRGLFRAVAEAMEAELMGRAIEIGNQHGDSWKGLESAIAVTLDSGLARDYQQIILRDAPNVIGASEWRAIEDQYSLGMLRDVVEAMMGNGIISSGSPDMVTRTLVAVIGELAVSIANAEDPPSARREADRLIRRILAAISTEG
jgi:AcrR family transcriptional regulator